MFGGRAFDGFAVRADPIDLGIAHFFRILFQERCQGNGRPCDYPGVAVVTGLRLVAEADASGSEL
jgi:hypothetical protein